MEYRVRRSYGRIKEIVPPPYLLQDVRDSFDRFITEGIKRAFDDISPIEGMAKTI